MTGKVINIKRFAVHDGPGIRTTVFLKGCPLSCLWCHNPEGISDKPELAYIEKKCISCGECVRVCPSGAHIMVSNIHHFSRPRCIGCGKCADVCLGDALLFYGREMTAEEILEAVLADKDFYCYSNGGVTLSGGEPLLQYEFCAEILRMSKEKGINTAIDTCGAVEWEAFEAVIPYTDLFLYDIKHMNADIHKKMTGMENNKILGNLLNLSKRGSAAEIRIPLIPGINSDRIALNEIGSFLSKIPGITAIRLLPYHSFAGSKYDSLGKHDEMLLLNKPSDELLHDAQECLKRYGLKVYIE
jgi:pyruvate formate lyase activating enzyme